MISVILVNYNSGNYTFEAVESLYAHLNGSGNPAFEVIIVDNYSTDGSADRVADGFPGITLIRQENNLGFGAACNIGVQAAAGDVLLLFNNDAYLKNDSILRLTERVRSDKTLGILGPLVRFPDGRYQISSGAFPGILTEFTAKYLSPSQSVRQAETVKLRGGTEVDWVSGVCMCIRRELYLEAGGFDPRFFIYMEDVDLCKRIREMGYTVRLDPDGELYHHLNKSSEKAPELVKPEAKRSQLYYYAKHKGKLSFIILKAYLKCRFFLKLWAARLTGRDTGLIRETIGVVDRFRYDRG